MEEDQARAAARQLADQGFDAFEVNDFKTAADRFGRAYAVLRVPRIGLDYARSLEKLGRLVEASERYAEISRLPVPALKAEVHQQAQRDAAVELEALRPRLPFVKININGLTAKATVTIDGRPLAAALLDTDVPVDPGKHTLEVVEGDRKDSRTIEIAEREKLPVALTLPPPPPAPDQPPPKSAPAQPSGPSGLAIGGWIGVGLGGAGLVFGGVAAGIAWGQSEALDESGGCNGDVCVPSLQDAVDSFNASRTASTVGFVLGAVGLATGATLLIIDLTATNEPGEPSVSAWAAPQGVGLRATF